MHAMNWTTFRRLTDWAFRIRTEPGTRRFSPWDVIA